MRYLAKISYDGSKYKGYQKQPNTKTIQGELERVLNVINHTFVNVHGSGRTDAGVHAFGQMIHFDLIVDMNEKEVKKAMNSLLSPDIYVRAVTIVNDDFHARFDVRKKEYIYQLNMGEYDPIQKDYVYQYNQELDVKAINKAMMYLKGEHNFRSFTKVDEEKESYVRNIYEAKIQKDGNFLIFTFVGNGFMRYMVRNLVGTLIEVGEGKRKPQEIDEILKAEDRKMAGKTAPACGLYLKAVSYE